MMDATILRSARHERRHVLATLSALGILDRVEEAKTAGELGQDQDGEESELLLTLRQGSEASIVSVATVRSNSHPMTEVAYLREPTSHRSCIAVAEATLRGLGFEMVVLPSWTSVIRWRNPVSEDLEWVKAHLSCEGARIHCNVTEGASVEIWDLPGTQACLYGELMLAGMTEKTGFVSFGWREIGWDPVSRTRRRSFEEESRRQFSARLLPTTE